MPQHPADRSSSKQVGIVFEPSFEFISVSRRDRECEVELWPSHWQLPASGLPLLVCFPLLADGLQSDGRTVKEHAREANPFAISRIRAMIRALAAVSAQIKEVIVNTDRIETRTSRQMSASASSVEPLGAE